MTTITVRRVKYHDDVSWSVINKDTGFTIIGGLSKSGAVRKKNYLLKLLTEAYQEGTTETVRKNRNP